MVLLVFILQVLRPADFNASEVFAFRMPTQLPKMASIFEPKPAENPKE
jgi:hypothetical protein